MPDEPVAVADLCTKVEEILQFLADWKREHEAAQRETREWINTLPVRFAQAIADAKAEYIRRRQADSEIGFGPR